MPAPPAPEQPLPPPPPVAEEPGWVTDVIPVQNVDVRSLAQALAIFNAHILPNRDLRILAVKASPETIQTIRETVQRLDQPAQAFHNVEITTYLLQASPSPGGSGELPAAIQKLVSSLQASLG
jgi:type II secretory pathway component GspD/PulD (secretin)